jgi:ABC-type oligopeptide transport system substrate-binding subunit
MKHLRVVFMMMSVLALSLSSCSSTTIVNKKTAPPGQVKKATGSKSAAPYAPGQQKKTTAPGQKKKKS